MGEQERDGESGGAALPGGAGAVLGRIATGLALVVTVVGVAVLLMVLVVVIGVRGQLRESAEEARQEVEEAADRTVRSLARASGDGRLHDAEIYRSLGSAVVDIQRGGSRVRVTSFVRGDHRSAPRGCFELTLVVGRPGAAAKPRARPEGACPDPRALSESGARGRTRALADALARELAHAFPEGAASAGTATDARARFLTTPLVRVLDSRVVREERVFVATVSGVPAWSGWCYEFRVARGATTAKELGEPRCVQAGFAASPRW